jgi:hypothetical protein
MAGRGAVLLQKDLTTERMMLNEAIAQLDEKRAEGEARNNLVGTAVGIITAGISLYAGVDPRIGYKIGQQLGYNASDANEGKSETTLYDMIDPADYKFNKGALEETESAYLLQNELSDQQDYSNLGKSIFDIAGIYGSNYAMGMKGNKDMNWTSGFQTGGDKSQFRWNK